MSKSEALLRTLAVCALLSISHIAQAQYEACVTTYMDYSIDSEDGEIAAWSLVEDYVDTGWCAEQVGFWGDFFHSYTATVSILSPTLSSASNVGTQSHVPYGGGSAQSFAWLPYENDYGVFDIESDLAIFCTIGGLIIDELLDDYVEIADCPNPPLLFHLANTTPGAPLTVTKSGNLSNGTITIG